MSVTTRPTLADLRQSYAEYRQTPEWKFRVRRSNAVWRAMGWTATAGPLAAHALHYENPPRWVLSACALALAYTLVVKVAGELAKAAGSRKATKREPQHLFGYGSLYHEKWWNLIPVSPGVNWMENALLFGGHRSKRHPWRTFWRTVVAAVIVRGWWVVSLTVAALWYWSPPVVIAWAERAASHL